jgi:hypothetical protein
VVVRIESRGVEAIPMLKKVLVVLATASVGLMLNGPLASAQTLTVVTPSTHADSKALRDLDHGSATHLALTGHYHPRKSSNPPAQPTKSRLRARL